MCLLAEKLGQKLKQGNYLPIVCAGERSMSVISVVMFQRYHQNSIGSSCLTSHLE